MPIESGRYFIINVQTKNRAHLHNANSEEPVQGRYKQYDAGEQWEVIKRDNGHHTIRNIGHNQYATSGSRSPAGETVKGWEKPQTWLIQKTAGKGQYTISTTDTKIFWGLADGEQGTPIVLADAPTNKHYWWMFEKVEKGNETQVDQDLHNDTAAGNTIPRAVFLIELVPPPVSPSEPFELDLFVIQEMPYNFIQSATETADKICRPLIKSKQLKPSDLLIQLIEFESFREAYHFRYFGPDSFDNLRRYQGVNFPWMECSEPVISSFLTKGMNGFRSSATKVVVLNLRYIPLQNGGQEQLQRLTKQMIEKDVILILTLSEPHRLDTLFHTDLFQEFARLSSRTIFSLPVDGGGFYPCIVDYLQNFDADSIVTKISDVMSINPKTYLRQRQPERPDEPRINKPYGTLRPEEITEDRATQSSTSLASVASLSGPYEPREITHGKLTQLSTPSSPVAPLPASLDDIDESPSGSYKPREVTHGKPTQSSTSLPPVAPLPASLDDDDANIARDNGRTNTTGTNTRDYILPSVKLNGPPRSQWWSTPTDLDTKVSLHRQFLDIYPAPNPGRSAELNSLANILFTRFQQQGALDDLNEAISWLREALDLRPPPHPLRSKVLNNLAVALFARFTKQRGSKDLDESIAMHGEALNLRRAPHPDRITSLDNLAIALGTRCQQRPGVAPNDLDKAIALHREVLDLQSAPHPCRATSLHNLAVALQTRFDQRGNTYDCEEANSLRQEAEALLSQP